MKLKTLKIQNLILIRDVKIEFGQSLNIFTGETGAGKSAILSAIRLISGERADTDLIQKGSDLAIIEAEFEEGTFFRRELYASGKNRCFIDDRQVSLAELKEKAYLEVVDQQSSCVGKERALLDLYCRLDLSEYLESSLEEKKLQEKLTSLLQIPKEKELEWAQKELEWMEKINPQKEEEKQLHEEHQLLCQKEKFFSDVQSIASLFSEESALYAFKKARSMLEKLSSLSLKFQKASESMRTAIFELEEVSCFIQSYFDQMDLDPKRLEWIEKRLSDLASLKKKFGPDLEAERQKRIEIIAKLSRLEEEIQLVKTKLLQIQKKNHLLKEEISKKRKELAPLFAKAILKELKELNLPHARFEISVKEKFNEIDFLFSANPNQNPTPVGECASGGELCRLLLAIKLVLADSHATLIFDEIDQNIGGQTASILAEKLKALSEKRQLIYITHFVQVAKRATDHFLVRKEMDEKEALTKVKKLNDNEKEIEYNRMLGK